MVSSVAKVLAMKIQGTQFNPRHSCEKLGVVAHTCNPRAEEAETHANLWHSVAGQPS